MKCAFCKVLLETTTGPRYGECSLIAPNGNGIVARLCNDCLLALGQLLDSAMRGGLQAVEKLAEKTETVPIFVPPSIWKNGG